MKYQNCEEAVPKGTCCSPKQDMEPKPFTGSSTKADIMQRIVTMLGGTVIGMQTNITNSELKPLTAEQQTTYLRAIETPSAKKRAIKAPGPAEASDKQSKEAATPSVPGSDETDPEETAMQRFFKEPFRVAGQEPPQELEKAIEQEWTSIEKDQAVPSILLLAESGSGKTLALHQLCKQFAEKSLQRCQESVNMCQAPEMLIPLLINLADLRAGTSLLSLARVWFNGIAKTQAQDRQIEELLHNCIVFLDGLDEAPQGEVESIRLFMKEHTRTRFVVTARPSENYQKLGALRVLRLLDLDAEQVKKIMGGRWETTSESVRQLARNRSLLRIILDQPEDLAVQTKGHLVQERLVKQLEAIDNELDRALLRDITERLAFALYREHTIHCDERKVMEVADAYLREWHEDRPWRCIGLMLQKTGIMTCEKGGRWKFCDRLTQAYYAAAAIARNPELLSFALERASDPWWFELWEVLVGLSVFPLDLMLGLIDQAPIAAARCQLFSGVSFTQDIADALFDALQERRTFGRSADREKVIECLGWFNHSKIPAELCRTIKEESQSSVVQIAVAQYCQLIQEDRIALLEPEIKTKEHMEAAIKDLFDLWKRYMKSGEPKEQQGIEGNLIELLQRTRGNLRVSGIAAIMLGLIGTKSAREALYTKFKQEKTDKFVAWCATDALAHIQHPATRQLALDVCDKASDHSDQPSKLRERAVYLLGWMEPNELAEAAVKKALGDKSADIRRRAAQSLGHWRANWSREILEEQLKHESEEKVIGKLAQALGQVGNKEMLPLLKDRLSRMLYTSTRRHLRNAIDEIHFRHVE